MTKNFIKKKSLGQNFLRSEKALSQIVGAGELQKGDNILEIGPGDGALTSKILEKLDSLGGGKLFLIEKDDRLVPILQEKFVDHVDKITLIHKDILEVFETGDIDEMVKTGQIDADEGPNGANFKIIANIPYYITGAIIRKIFELQNMPKIVVLLVQKEVADRVVDKKESLLSVSVKFYGSPKRIAVVPKGAFSPSPTVDSAIIAINNIHKPESPKLEKTFFTLVKSAFAHKRKLLIRNLEAFNGFDSESSGKSDSKIPRPKIDWIKIFTDLNINPKARAEDVSTEQYIAITKHLV